MIWPFVGDVGRPQWEGRKAHRGGARAGERRAGLERHRRCARPRRPRRPEVADPYTRAGSGGQCLDYLDPVTEEPLPTWYQALDRLAADEDTRPAHVIRFGAELDVKGLLGGTPDADRSVRYLTKYLTKAVGETYTDAEHTDAAYEAHIDRLHAEVRYLPCSPDCANWLRFGAHRAPSAQD